MRIGWVAALVLVVAAGCGSSDDSGPDELPPTPPAATPLPDFDPSSKAEAEKLLKSAFDQLIEHGSTSFRTKVTLFGAEMTTTGRVDLARESGEFELQITGEPVEAV